MEICERAPRLETRPDVSLLEVVLEVVAMVFAEVFLICSENWRLATHQVGYTAPAQVHISLAHTSSSLLSYPAHVELNMRLAAPVDWLSRVPQDPRSVDWLLAVRLGPPLSPHQTAWAPMTSSTFLLLIRKPHL